MKKRTIEAEKIEKDYMLRLKKSIAQYNAIEAVEIEQDVIEHIEEAVNELGEEEVSLTVMANVLEKLGAPEIYASEVGVENAKNKVEKEQEPAKPTQGLKPTEDISGYTKLLDKIWLGFLISIIGLFIPIIGLRICAIIGTLTVAFAIFSYKGSFKSDIGWVAVLCIFEALLYCCTSLISTLTLFVPVIGILQLVLIFPLLIISFIIYWKILSNCANVLDIYDLSLVAESVRVKRNIGLALYIIMVFVGFGVGIVIGLFFADKARPALANAIMGSIAGCVMLPFSWLLGWLFSLRPITETRQALRKI